MTKPRIPVVRQWRINVKSNDGTTLDSNDFMPGRFSEAQVRARILARRASYVVNGPNRTVYVSVEVWNAKEHKWYLVWDKKGKVAPNWHPDQNRPFTMPEVSWRDGGIGGVTT